ncbi:MAG: hypothetical protein ABI960_06750 [Candidatus Eisenbacteria bacterium]
MNLVHLPRSLALATMAFTLLTMGPSRAQSECCLVADIGGTAQVPPACPDGYVDGQSVRLNGLPPGIPITATLSIINIQNVVEGPGGALGGTTQTWDAILRLHLEGDPTYPYDRVFLIPVSCSSDAAPRAAAAPVQSFQMELTGLQGQVAPGDPDFDLLRVIAGSGFGLPSPGHTTLTKVGAMWAVDSFFDITYRIDYIGHSPGPFGGYSNSQTESYQPFEMCHEHATPARASSWGAVKSLYR